MQATETYFLVFEKPHTALGHPPPIITNLLPSIIINLPQQERLSPTNIAALLEPQLLSRTHVPPLAPPDPPWPPQPQPGGQSPEAQQGQGQVLGFQFFAPAHDDDGGEEGVNEGKGCGEEVL